MNENTRKLVILNLALALVVLVLFAFAPRITDSHYTDTSLIPGSLPESSLEGTTLDRHRESSGSNYGASQETL